ncbi:hypothetical protein PGT21_011410 [Puccinia graminis f. sp. tritici]|uniref:Superoxide dismutase copper/zinc binding domain-containing protein n=1 Tax=Puccinia graminis f. sp. tritici TaxID=56615 RepID=A0A5B0NL72_PUCGR|nr:hypothetical protein PGT21_011410 [Puccinia graminis f. sp. tritici]
MTSSESQALSLAVARSSLEQLISELNSNKVTVFGLDHSLPHGEHAYHIHANPVDADGNCEATGGHLNPTGIADSVTCNPMVPKTCKEGDLSGKHGVLAGAQRSIQLSYTNPNLQFSSPESGIIGHGLVIHDSKGARIACGKVLPFAHMISSFI